MSAEYASAVNYLRQLATQVKRPIQWAFLLGIAKTVAVVIQLTLLALLAHRLLVEQQALVQQLWVLAGLLISSLLRATMPWLQNYFLRQATVLASHHARQQLLQRWRQQAHSGQLLSAADGALQLEPIESLKGYFSRYLVQQYLVIFSPLLILLVCFYLNPVVGFLLLFSGPIIPLFMALVGMGAERLSQKHAQQQFALSRVFTDKLRNLTTLKLFNAGDVAIADVAAAGESYRKANMSTLRIAFLSSAVLEFFSSVAIAGIALYVGFGLLGYIDWLGADQLTLFSGLLVLLLAPEYFAPLRQFAQSYHDRAAAIGAATLLCQKDQPTHTTQHSITPAERGFSWCDLRVAFSPDCALNFADNAIDAGEFCVISGNSGSGKTTLLKVLMGQMPFTGRLHSPVRQIDSLAYFAQQPFLVAGSLRHNINLFEKHDDAEIHAMLNQVQLSDLLSRLPNGLDSKMGDGGEGLSGGEQRRVALARCLLAKRPILIADEPTENLDAVSAHAIRECLQHYVDAGHTVIVATHDPQLMAMATRHIRVTQ